MIEGLRNGLAELGLHEGREFVFEFRFAGGRLDRLPQLAAELIQADVDVLVAGSNPGALAAKNASAKIPIVFVTTGDPISGGLVDSLARPAGNLTGITALGQDLISKRLQLLKEAFPRIKRVIVLVNSGSPYSDDFIKVGKDAARSLSIELLTLDVQDPGALPSAAQTVRTMRAEALLVPNDIMFITNRGMVVEVAAAVKIPQCTASASLSTMVV